MLPLWNAWYFLALYAGAADGPSGPGGSGCAAPTPATCSTGTSWPRPPSWCAEVTGRVGRLRPGRRLRVRADLPRGADQLVHPPVPAAVLGRRRRRHRHPAHGAGDGVPGGGAVAAADRRDGVARPDRRAHRAPDRLAVDPASCRQTPSWWRPWTRSREVASTALSVRKAAGLRVRQPLASHGGLDRECGCAATVLGLADRRGQRRVR